MNLTLISCLCDRPEAWALVESYIARQSHQPYQWICVDDDDPPSKCTMGQEYYYLPHLKGRGSMVNKIKTVLLSDLVKGDALVFIENDDWLHPNWLAECHRKLTSHDMVGEGMAFYYNVRRRMWSIHNNRQHASLCSTAVTRAVFPYLLKLCANPDPFIDSRLWTTWNGTRHVFYPNNRMTVGIKAMPGLAGAGNGHVLTEKDNWNPDPTMAKLRDLIGADADAYEKFY